MQTKNDFTKYSIQWHWLTNAIKIDKIPNSLLFTGSDFCGLYDVAFNLVQFALCENRALNYPCLTCKSCKRIHNFTHPDVKIIKGEDGKISIDEVRAVIEYINKRGILSSYKFTIIDSIDDMNLAAINALLKTIEDLALTSIVILLSYNRNFIPKTLKSRCCEIKFPQPTLNNLQDILSTNISEEKLGMLGLLATNKPKKAEQLLENEEDYNAFIACSFAVSNIVKNKDLVGQSDKLAKYEITQIIQYFQFILSDAIKLKANSLNPNYRDPTYFEEIKTITYGSNFDKLFACLDYLATLYKETAILKIKPSKTCMIDRLTSMLI